MLDGNVASERLKLDEKEVMLNAQKDGVKMAADRRVSNAKLDLEADRQKPDRNSGGNT